MSVCKPRTPMVSPACVDKKSLKYFLILRQPWPKWDLAEKSPALAALQVAAWSNTPLAAALGNIQREEQLRGQTHPLPQLWGPFRKRIPLPQLWGLIRERNSCVAEPTPCRSFGDYLERGVAAWPNTLTGTAR